MTDTKEAAQAAVLERQVGLTNVEGNMAASLRLRVGGRGLKLRLSSVWCEYRRLACESNK